MARPSRARGPYGDPRLLERQGDVLGLSALGLAALMVCAVVAMGALMVGVGRLVPPPPALPTALAAAPPVVVASVSPSARPSPTPRPTTSPEIVPDAIRVAAGDPAPILERGQQVGTVTVESAAYPARILERDPPAGRRWLRVSLTYRATADVAYLGSRWSALDATGRRHRWAGAEAPEPALGGGSLRAGQRRTGYLVIAVPATIRIQWLVLQDADGRDIVLAALR